MIGLGLAADAFAVAVGKGLSLKRMDWKIALIVGLYFGIFQTIMPLGGFFLGKSLGGFIGRFGGIITFCLLIIIGINMMKEAFDDKEDTEGDILNFISMLMLSIATSIDAFALGITFSFFEVNIWLAIFLIGIITFFISALGVKVGNVFGSKYEKSAQILGGLILIFIGIKSLF